jgi:hypothetical protein
MEVQIQMKEEAPITISGLRLWLPIMIAVGGIIFSYALSTFKVNALQERMSSVELRRKLC